MNYTDELVIKVNTLFHDFEGIDYSDKHPEIFKDEVSRWERVVNEYFRKNKRKGLKILDIGSGTGFVPFRFVKDLEGGDEFVCSDVSRKMLDVCREELNKVNNGCKFSFLNLGGKNIPVEDNSCDFVTLNSVLHHIPDLEIFYKEMDRIIKSGGYLFISHEPNKAFYSNRFLWKNYRVLLRLLSPKIIIDGILRRLSIAHKEQIKKSTEGSDQIEYVNRKLLEEGGIQEPLTYKQITEIVDIHSPTAGGFHKDRGINIDEMVKEKLKNFNIEFLETYNHLCKISNKNAFTKIYSGILNKLMPNKGSLFFIVLKKK